jgi:hypothetical protein
MPRKEITTEEWISRAQSVHGNKYDYSLSIYTHHRCQIKVICPVHGMFEQMAIAHVSGNGCRQCGKERTSLALAFTTEEFILRARKLHNTRYDYSLVEYINSSQKIQIICSRHGMFTQAPGMHLHQKTGCPKCNYVDNGIRKQRNKARQFISRAQSVHANKYDYSKSVYQGARTLTTIICHEHGDFLQAPNPHLKGAGCPRCAKARLSKEWVDRATGQISLLYFLKIYNEDETFYKIGITYRRLCQRFCPSNLKGYNYILLALYESDNAQAVWGWEDSILQSFTHLRYKPKRSFGGKTECFSEAEPLLAAMPFGTKFY